MTFRVVRRQRHVGAEPGRIEQGLQGGASGETEGVSDDRMFGQLAEGQFSCGSERMSFRQDDGVMPSINRQADQVRKRVLRSRDDRKVDLVAPAHFGDLLRSPLVKVQAHVRVLRQKPADDLRQHIACLGVSGGDGQRAAHGFAQRRPDPLHVANFPQDAHGPPDDVIAGRRGADQRATPAFEQMQSQLLLQQFYLPADRRLGRVKLARGRRDVEALLVNGGEIAQLLQVDGHGASASRRWVDHQWQ